MDNKNTPGYKMGVFIGRMLWVAIAICVVMVGIMAVAAVAKLMLWFLTLLFL